MSDTHHDHQRRVHTTMTVSSSIYAISARLGWVPSLCYAAIYLVLIPAFALFYCWLTPHQFYHTTAQYEEYLKQDKRAILDALTLAVFGAFSPVSCNDLQIDGRRFTIHGRTLCSADYTGFSLQYYSIEFQMSLNEPSRIGWGDCVPLSVIRPNQTYGNCNVSDLEIPTCFDIPPQLYSKMLAYADGMNGFPSLSSGRFGRMFYLSAITIATVGYGDIVPITPMARLAVACEAIAGVVLMGLFLNALAHEYNRRSSKRAP